MAQEFHAGQIVPRRKPRPTIEAVGQDPVRGSGTNPFNGR